MTVDPATNIALSINTGSQSVRLASYRIEAGAVNRMKQLHYDESDTAVDPLSVLQYLSTPTLVTHRWVNGGDWLIGPYRYRAEDAEELNKLVAIGAYQLQQCLLAWRRLVDRGLTAAVAYLLEPGRFREFPRDTLEAGCQAVIDNLLPAEASRVILTHTRPEAIRGLLPDDRATRVLGYHNRGGTLGVEGMLFANGCSWLHVLTAFVELTGNNIADWPASTEQDALAYRIDPRPLLRVEENS